MTDFDHAPAISRPWMHPFGRFVERQGRLSSIFCRSLFRWPNVSPCRPANLGKEAKNNFRLVLPCFTLICLVLPCLPLPDSAPAWPFGFSPQIPSPTGRAKAAGDGGKPHASINCQRSPDGPRHPPVPGPFRPGQRQGRPLRSLTMPDLSTPSGDISSIPKL